MAAAATLPEAQQRAAALLEAHDTVKALERQLRQAKATRDELDAQVREDLTEMGADAVRVDGRTLYLKRDLFAAHLKNKADTIEVLKGLPDYGDLVEETVNGNTLNALVREFIKDVEPGNEATAFPEALRPVLSFSERFSIGIRKA